MLRPEYDQIKMACVITQTIAETRTEWGVSPSEAKILLEAYDILHRVMRELGNKLPIDSNPASDFEYRVATAFANLNSVYNTIMRERTPVNEQEESNIWLGLQTLRRIHRRLVGVSHQNRKGVR